jgi:RNA polymerase sigma-70 factor (ECF subfamily)
VVRFSLPRGLCFEVSYERALNEPHAVASAEHGNVDRKGVELASLEAFVLEHYPRLVRLAGLVTRDVDQAQDAVQAALERAWRKRQDVRGASALRPWLDRIVVREAIRHTRVGPIARLLRGESTEWTNLAANLPEPAERLMLREALGRLSPDHRAVVALHLYAGYSVDETARMLQVPFDTVRSRLRAARERLRREISEVTP